MCCDEIFNNKLSLREDFHQKHSIELTCYLTGGHLGFIGVIFQDSKGTQLGFFLYNSYGFVLIFLKFLQSRFIRV